ncbi:DUF1304 domain-containing protein [Leptospira yasudae]|uniref:DUF1304 domain-containing protein n=1 Tax=Leptospira yasudae TaxID=2202201 RepID=A0A5F2BFU7_9LEPT|nr:DUF1304 domain-containing protein [Leptospira yasudae]MBW0433072.1 DUF1304 domain-containing protein [Leptospira yasudae]TGK30181.1 DUF1304 domain-containing protein [Leptospira yasudae]TGL78606.1 DUF1304 domain-containing protein [Leptospira yasudae]TGL79950.1 DUF1304 domain-containing protein [Leptospira yasudae]TGL80771.1 DUF1304 domain-containing protein [Leptospira yasudae]
MILAARILAGIVGALHVWIFLMESVLWMKPTIHRRFGVTDKKLAEAMKGVFLNQGFYNLFLAIGALYGAAFFDLHANYAPAIMIFSCLSVFGAGVVLFASKPSMARAAIIQGLPPLIAIVLIGIAVSGG